LGAVVPPDAGDDADVFGGEDAGDVVVVVAGADVEFTETAVEDAEAAFDGVNVFGVDVEFEAVEDFGDEQVEAVREHVEAFGEVVVAEEDEGGALTRFQSGGMNSGMRLPMGMSSRTRGLTPMASNFARTKVDTASTRSQRESMSTMARRRRP
jgi:hypothetical protein